MTIRWIERKAEHVRLGSEKNKLWKSLLNRWLPEWKRTTTLHIWPNYPVLTHRSAWWFKRFSQLLKQRRSVVLHNSCFSLTFLKQCKPYKKHPKITDHFKVKVQTPQIIKKSKYIIIFWAVLKDLGYFLCHWILMSTQYFYFIVNEFDSYIYIYIYIYLLSVPYHWSSGGKDYW